jgi:hypothetical protein
MRKRYPEKYKEFIQFEAYTKNPYDKLTGIGRVFKSPHEDLLAPVLDKNGNPSFLEGDHTKFVAQKLDKKLLIFDRRQYAKIYLEFISLIVKEGLTQPASKLLFFIFKRLTDGGDTVRFTISSAKAHTGYKSDKSIYEGLVELIKLGVIARKDDTEEEYFINPQYIFRGKRDKIFANSGDGE